MFYDIYTSILSSLEIFLKIVGMFTCFYLIAKIGARYEDRHRQKKNA